MDRHNAAATQGRRILAGLIGRGIQASRTPRMHEAEGERLGLRYLYQLIDLDRLQLHDAALPELLLAAQRLGFSGLNITHPFKRSVIDWLDELSPEAAAIGAVNTVVLSRGRRIGHNTDGWGFAESFRRGMSGVPLERVVQFGAGGAGMAVARALLELGTRHLDIVDTEAARAEALAASLTQAFGAGRAAATGDAEAAVAGGQGLVNTTPLGMAKYPGMPVARPWLRPDLWVADIVYFPAATELLQAARERGARTLAGTGMAIFQAVRAFELITGVTPDADEMAGHFASS